MACRFRRRQALHFFIQGTHYHASVQLHRLENPVRSPKKTFIHAHEAGFMELPAILFLASKPRQECCISNPDADTFLQIPRIPPRPFQALPWNPGLNPKLPSDSVGSKQNSCHHRMPAFNPRALPMSTEALTRARRQPFPVRTAAGTRTRRPAGAASPASPRSWPGSARPSGTPATADARARTPAGGACRGRCSSARRPDR